MLFSMEDAAHRIDLFLIQEILFPVSAPLQGLDTDF